MRRINITIDSETQELLNTLATQFYGGNRSFTIRAALQSLASQVGQQGWVIRGYVPVAADPSTACHSCGRESLPNDVFYRPVFERGGGQHAFSHLPHTNWLDCQECAEKQVS